MFKKRRGIHIPYNKQGLVYFICVNIKDMSEQIKNRIIELCMFVAGEHWMALYDMLTDDARNVHSVAMEYHISETQLYHYRKLFYEKFFDDKSP